MENVSQNLYRCLRHFAVCFLLICLSETKRCSYRLYSHDHRLHAQEYKHHEPTQIGVKDCTWGCCWEQRHDVCCPFPMEVVLVGLISFICVIIVIAALVSLIKYLLSRWRRICVHSNGTVCRHGILGNMGTFVYPCPSTILHQNYIQLDTKSPPTHVNLIPNPASKDSTLKTEREIASEAEQMSQLVPIMS